MPFLTDLDSRAAVKGSRDPLGIQPIWTRLGRHVIGNLTTQSTSVRDFGTLLLGYHFAEVLTDQIGPGTETATFIKWEQLAAYSRAWCNADFSFRGVGKVRSILSEGSRVTLSDDRGSQILSNQRTYGLWGLYTGPARTSSLLDGDPVRLTAAGRDIVDSHYLPKLDGASQRYVRRIRQLLESKRSPIDLNRGDQPLAAAVAGVLSKKLSAVERRFFREYLLYGGPQDDTAGRQRQMADLIAETADEDEWDFTPARVRHFAKRARSKGESWEPLAHRLDRIATCESVMAPASVLFGHLLGLDGKRVSSIAERLRSAWGPTLRTVDPALFAELHAELSAGDKVAGDRWVALAEAFAAGDYSQALLVLADQNKSVMEMRGGVAWIEIGGGMLHVRVRDEQGGLREGQALIDLWRFPYFLDSLRIVSATLAERSHG